MKLDIGSGTNPKKGYRTVDLYVQADYQVPMWQLPFQGNSVAEIYSSHALEHVPINHVIPTLMEWYRVLIVGGLLELRVPDLVWCIDNWKQNQNDYWALAMIFGSQENEGNFHRTGFTRPLLREYLVSLGFKIIEESDDWTHNQKTLVFKAIK